MDALRARVVAASATYRRGKPPLPTRGASGTGLGYVEPNWMAACFTEARAPVGATTRHRSAQAYNIVSPPGKPGLPPVDVTRQSLGTVGRVGAGLSRTAISEPTASGQRRVRGRELRLASAPVAVWRMP